MGRNDRLDIQAPGIGGPPDSYYHQREDDEPPVDYTALQRAAADAREAAIPALRNNATVVQGYVDTIKVLLAKHATDPAEFTALSYVHALLRADVAGMLERVRKMEHEHANDPFRRR